MVTVLLFAVSLSLDAIAVGFSYGVKKIKIPILSAGVVGMISIGFSALATYAGKWLSTLLPPAAARWIGIGMLLALGIWTLLQALLEKEPVSEAPQDKQSQDKTVLHLMLKSLGLSVTIIKHPVDCDFDGSKRIDLLEAFYLGLMLSMDAICSCIGLALSGTVYVVTPLLIGAFQWLFLQCGDLIGRYLSRLDFLRPKLIALLPGVILIGIALLRLL